jgi:putative peptidoglycan binding protein
VRSEESRLLLLQGQIGNAAVARLVRSGGSAGLQRSCGCGGGCSSCKDEAPLKAELLGDEQVQRSCACGGKCEDCKGQGEEREAEGVQRKQAPAEPTLRQGSRSPAVLELQQLLVAQGAAIEPDGVFGPKTARAVKDFQRGAGLAPDGIVGAKTWSALRGGGVQAESSPGHELILTKLRSALELLKGLQGRPAEPKVPPQVAAAETAGVGFLDDLGDAAESAADWVGEKASEASSWVGDKASEAASWAEEKAEGAVSWAEGKASEASSWVEEKVTEGAEWVEQKTTEAGEAAVKAVDDTVGEVGGVLSGIGDDLRKRFGPELDALERAVADLGRGLRVDLDFDELNRLLDIFVNGISAKNAVNANEGAAANPDLKDCGFEVEAVPMGGDLCPPEAVKEIGPDGNREPVCGSVFTYGYPRLIQKGSYCPISIGGAKLTEVVTSDGAVSGKSSVRTGDCPIGTDGTMPECRDTYGICLPSKQVLSKLHGGHATETFTQQLFVQGLLIETHQIKFNFMREGPFCYVSSIARE